MTLLTTPSHHAKYEVSQAVVEIANFAQKTMMGLTD